MPKSSSQSPPSNLAVGSSHKSISDHPTTVNITTKPPIPPQQQQQQQQYYHQHPQTPTSPFMTIPGTMYNYAHNFKSVSSASSPSTTPGFSSPPLPNGDLNSSSALSYQYNQQQSYHGQQMSQQQSHQQSTQPTSISTSTSSLSLPSFITNQTMIQAPNSLASHSAYSPGSVSGQASTSNLSHNSSRSFGDINDAIINTTGAPTATSHTHSQLTSGQMTLTPSTANSLSPTASLATTPTTYNTLSSSFLRIFIGTSTAVVSF